MYSSFIKGEGVVQVSHLLDGFKRFDDGVVGRPDFFGDAVLVELNVREGTVLATGRVDWPRSSSAVWKLAAATTDSPQTRR